MRTRTFLILAGLLVLASAGCWVADNELATVVFLVPAAICFIIAYSSLRKETRNQQIDPQD
ncbi:hypothetical protein L1O03_06335 [Corynebacterium uropygiale]|uniref:Uncharacterized protein n=1 Tax=Corynebacterium uropygiale TaxID=1775911 RepID=A0A9X1QQY4_9CORY|nr:hypothetical protein [Corynebacterium uropygiale]MCF4006797.1 hypothetical protein [Corynebacterium uropygiale]